MWWKANGAQKTLDGCKIYYSGEEDSSQNDDGIKKITDYRLIV